MKVSTVLGALAGLVATGSAYSYADSCLDGISTDVTSFTFAGNDPEDYYGSMCTGNLSVISLWAAAKKYCTPYEIEVGYVTVNGYCAYGLVELTPYADIEPLLTDEYMAAMHVVNYEDIDPTVVLDYPILISQELFEAGRKTVWVFDRSYKLDSDYGWGVYGFWGTILLVGMISNLVNHLLASRRKPSGADAEGSRVSSAPSNNVFASVYHWARANLIIPAAFGSHHQRLWYWCTVPTRMETIIVFAFWALNLILCCVSYDIFDPNLYYTRSSQYWRYIADRTGVICYANLPLLWMFAGRNNIFIWLTGWNFGTFNIFHRHIARIATVQAIVHSIAYSALEANFGYFAESWTEKYWYMGGMATIAMSLLLGFSSIFLRKHTYEIFLLLHISMSVLTIVGLFYHTEIFDGEYNGYLWPLVAIWCFDRFARIVRLAYCNLHVRFSKDIMTSETVATYNKDADIIRLDVIPGSGLLKPGAGQHYFLYQPLTWKAWENHPFTLGAWSPVDTDSSTRAVATTNTEQVLGTDKDISVSPASSSTHSSNDAAGSKQVQPLEKLGGRRQKLVFFVRPYSSWTKRLRDECIKSPTGWVKPRIYLEGPYGERSPLHKYENVIFIVGGTGISGALPYLQEHLRRTAIVDANGQKAPTTMTRDITLVWTTKQSAMIRDVATSELAPLLEREDFHYSFYATSRKEREEASATPSLNDKTEDFAKTTSATSASSDFRIQHHRPDVRETIMHVVNDVNAAGSAGGRIAILTCGPAGMADAARAAVHEAMKQGKKGLEYVEETFGW